MFHAVAPLITGRLAPIKLDMEKARPTPEQVESSPTTEDVLPGDTVALAGGGAPREGNATLVDVERYAT